VLAERQIRLGYAGREGRSSERVAHPLGLVSKVGVWYLIADTAAGRRTFRVDRVRSLELLEAPVVRPVDFDLAQVWREITVRVQGLVHPVAVTGVTEPGAVAALRHRFGTRLAVGPMRPDGRFDVEIVGPSVFVVAAELAGFAHALEVEAPAEVRNELAGIGERLTERYRSR
jgi:predicted DNA-binding transcriptional regulator YafY